jgi:hypothetical protein
LLTPAFVASRRGTAPEARLIALDGWILRNLGMTSAIVLTVMGFNIVMTALSHLR